MTPVKVSVIRNIMILKTFKWNILIFGMGQRHHSIFFPQSKHYESFFTNRS